MANTSKHENYDLLNLLGYGLAKFDNHFIEQFGFKTKTAFYEYFKSLGIVETTSVVKNRMDLFAPFFDNHRRGWWQKGELIDARLYGDGYDFQIDVNDISFLAEVKGIRAKKGRFRLTEKEYKKAQEYRDDYIITLVMNLNDKPKFLVIENPIKNLSFQERIIQSKITKEYHLTRDIC